MSGGGFWVRLGVEGDLAGVVALERGVAEAPHWGKAEYAGIFKAQGGGVRRCLFVAEAGDGLVGFAVGKVIAGSVAELESVAVEAVARRGGVGRALCEAVVDWCREQGVAALELEVRAGSAGAIALYEGLGFVAAGRRRAYYEGPVEDALLMGLDLAQNK
jgi:[ribosomal protein S18]-alanine N-acetyltransferase